MNHFPPPTIAAGNAEDTANIRAFLQQAVDHYPRLVVFSFTLTLPYRAIPTDCRSLILRFHTEVWQQIGEYSWEHQQARQNSPPTVLRWIWASTSAPECKMVLIMNLDTLGAARNAQHVENALKAIRVAIADAWQTVTGLDHDGITSITPMIINRSVRGTFTTPFNQLKALVQMMLAPVVTARTGVTG